MNLIVWVLVWSWVYDPTGYMCKKRDEFKFVNISDLMGYSLVAHLIWKMGVNMTADRGLEVLRHSMKGVIDYEYSG